MNISSLITNIDAFRYERKFAISNLDRHEVESVVKCHPASFSEIFQKRTVNSMYFDSLDMASYLDSQLGTSERLKVRVRWYGDTFGIIERPTLELKIKKGKVGSKILFPLVSFGLDMDFSFDSMRDVFRHSHIIGAVKEAIMSMKIKLLVCYSRKYFQSADKKYHLTLDWDIKYYKMDNIHNTFRHYKHDYVNTVLELKYASNFDDDVHAIVNYFPFRISRNSKYITGVENLF